MGASVGGIWGAAVIVAATSTATRVPDDAAPPISLETLDLVKELTRPASVNPWPAPVLDRRTVPRAQLREPMAPTVTRTFESLPVPQFARADRLDRRDRYLGPHFVERLVDGWLETEPRLWGEVALGDMARRRGGAAAVITLKPSEAPADPGGTAEVAALVRSADRSLAGHAGGGFRSGLLAGRLDLNLSGGGDLRVSGSPENPDTPSPRMRFGGAASLVVGGRPQDRGQLRLLGALDAADDAVDPSTGARSDFERTIIGLDGTLDWGSDGRMLTAASYQGAWREGRRHLGQGRLEVRTPSWGPLHVEAEGLAEGGEADDIPFGRYEAGGRVGLRSAPVVVEAGAMVLHHRLDEEAWTELGLSAALDVLFAAGWSWGTTFRRGRDLLATARSFSVGVSEPDVLTHAVYTGPSWTTDLGWVRLQAAARYFEDIDFDLPAWTVRSDGSFRVFRGLTVGGALGLRPNFGLHLFARYDVERAFVELHGRGQTENFESGYAEQQGYFRLGLMSGLDLGAGFWLALSVENMTDALVRDPDRGSAQSGIDGRVSLRFAGP